MAELFNWYRGGKVGVVTDREYGLDQVIHHE
jgi:hypothetical protein